MICVSMSAATTVLFEGKQALNWNDGLKIDAAQFDNAQAGDIITVTTDGGGFKLVVFSPWTVLNENGASGDGYAITDETLEAIKTDGIHVQGDESVNVLKVELSSDAPQPAEKNVVATLLNEQQTIGNWDNTVEVAGSLFTEAGVKEGDYIRVNYTTEGDAQIQLCANTPEWHNIYNCADLPAAKTVFDFLLTAKDLADIEADKLYIQGKNFTICNVQIVREATETAISNIAITAKTDKNNIYSIDGTRLKNKPQHGLYIMNGKKYIAK